jgi:hypothetical protein
MGRPMTTVPGVVELEETRFERGARIAFWALLILSWITAVAFMWEAMTRVPSAERLEESKLVAIPTLRTFLTAAIFSGMELAIVLAALWPWKPDFYASRLGVTALALVTWFITTTPMDVSRMDWIHRRWLAFLIVASTAALLTLLLYRLSRHLVARRWPPGESAPG